MASLVSIGGLTHAFQALSLETGSRRTSQHTRGNGISMLSTSFLGDTARIVSSSSGSAMSSRSFHALCVRMDSRLHTGDSFSPTGGDDSWKRPALAVADYAVSEADLDFSNLHGRQLRDRNGRETSYGSSHLENLETMNSGTDISALGLKDELVEALQKRGITHLFPIQDAVLKPATEGLDIIARARTGTGKTLAFGIPIIQNLLEQKRNGSRRAFRNPHVLVLAPTRELAMQVEKEFMESAPTLSTLCVYGGVPLGGQQRKLQNGVDIVVGTPGRIMDLIERGSLVLSEVKYLVLDEADQMLAIGFAEDVEKILENVPDNRQSMLFSATMPSWVSQIAKKYLKNPLKIDLVGDSKEKLAQGIKLFSISSPLTAKRSILSDLITVYGKGGKSIVFTQTKKDADEVALSMSRILGAEALHGDISQAQREKTLSRFRNGNFSVLIATDVAARGLDIPDVDLIIHYETPNDAETFVHRSGRTGRAGKAGTAILMHTSSQTRTIKSIERDVGCRFEPITAPTVNDVLEASSEQARDALSKVHPDLTSVFLPTAEKLLQEQGADALAAAIAHLSGFTQLPASRSLITHEQGWMTLQFTRTRGGSGLSTPGGVMGALGSIFQRAADEVGKIHILDPSEGMGAVFDLPEDVAKHLLAYQLPPGDCIQAISKLPRLQYDDMPRERYGMFSSRGGSFRVGSGGSSRGRGYPGSSRGSRRGSNPWGNETYNMKRTGSSWSDSLNDTNNRHKSRSSLNDNSNPWGNSFSSSKNSNGRSGSSWNENSNGMNRDRNMNWNDEQFFSRGRSNRMAEY